MATQISPSVDSPTLATGSRCGGHLRVRTPPRIHRGATALEAQRHGDLRISANVSKRRTLVEAAEPLHGIGQKVLPAIFEMAPWILQPRQRVRRPVGVEVGLHEVLPPHAVPTTILPGLDGPSGPVAPR